MECAQHSGLAAVLQLPSRIMVIFCCYLLMCVEQLQFLSPTETSGSPSDVSARSLATVQRLALRQEMKRTRCIYTYIFFSPWRNTPIGPGPPHCRSFAITLRHLTLGRTTLGELSAPRRNIYLTTINTHNRQAFFPPVGFEPAISASEWPLGLVELGT